MQWPSESIDPMQHAKGPVKKPQPDEMSHTGWPFLRGGGGVGGGGGGVARETVHGEAAGGGGGISWTAHTSTAEGAPCAWNDTLRCCAPCGCSRTYQGLNGK